MVSLDFKGCKSKVEWHRGELFPRIRRLALPPGVSHWSLTTLRDKLIKIGAKVVSSSRYITFQMAEVAVSQRLFTAILRRIRRLIFPLPVPR